MNPLISLIFRIACGEKLEPATKQNTAYWLSALVMVPLSIIGFAMLARWLESVIWSPFDSVASLIVFIVFFGLVLLGSVFSLARVCRNHPWFLILLSCGAWGMTAHLLWRHQ
jgi:glycerol-3-phosphate acyltransferase PlsY